LRLALERPEDGRREVFGRDFFAMRILYFRTRSFSNPVPSLSRSNKAGIAADVMIFEASSNTTEKQVMYMGE
jgi:type IV secretory pathway ATPase VirB11/archaellum biosynthesis ATPase